MLSTKKKIYFTLIIFAVIFAFLIKFLLASLSELKTASYQFNFYKKANELFEFRAGDLENFLKDKPRYLELLGKIKSSFVEFSSPINFIEFLESQAEEIGVSIKVNPLELKKTKDELWQSLNFVVSIAGSFPNCLKFLEKLERSQWFNEITRLDISRVGGREKERGLEEFKNLKVGEAVLTINLKVFSYEFSY